MSRLTDIQKWPGGYCDICDALLMDTIETEARRCAKCRLAVVIAAFTECAAGPWRYDVENAPKDGSEVAAEFEVLGYRERHFVKWHYGSGAWESPSEKLPNDALRAFAVPNPPQVTL